MSYPTLSFAFNTIMLAIASDLCRPYAGSRASDPDATSDLSLIPGRQRNQHAQKVAALSRYLNLVFNDAPRIADPPAYGVVMEDGLNAPSTLPSSYAPVSLAARHADHLRRCASATRSRPALVVGPVLSPPCMRQRPLARAGAAQGLPARVPGPNAVAHDSVSKHAGSRILHLRQWRSI